MEDSTESRTSEMRKTKIMKFVDDNLTKATERRLTIPSKKRQHSRDRWAMSKDNLRRLRNGYRHPFERIPESFFTGVRDSMRRHSSA